MVFHNEKNREKCLWKRVIMYVSVITRAMRAQNAMQSIVSASSCLCNVMSNTIKILVPIKVVVVC